MERKWITVKRQLWHVELPGDYTPEEFNEKFDQLVVKLEREPGKIVVCIDASLVSRSDARNRERSAQFFRERKELIETKIIAWAFVTPSSMLRGAVTAINWLGRFPVQTRSFEKVNDAHAWLEAQLL